ncbi:Hypothetical predicted protein [Pelobates cultripes]|uniref:Endonuclease/exonuclease/phosphatase domain-containing protein n=1 Tax=Pelobates cultripes TaxID=61616 RepID=A0AAD1W5A4_PELCU|nr:Hypothetical predicted protein [Pelobates cultripes]
MAYEPDPLRITTMNCRGLNIPERRSHLLRELTSKRISIAFLQETHFKEGHAPPLKSKHYPTAALSNHPTAHSSTGHSSITQGAIRSIQKTLKNLRLVDCWRAMHPADREYTHYSVIHKRYARIDYIFLQQEHLDAIQTAEIGLASWSDHGPVTLQMDSPRVRPTARSWRLQVSLLLDPSVKETVSEELTSYFALNETDDLPATTIWEAHKSVLRGTLMRLASQKKRESRKHMTDLLTRITTLEMQHKRSHLEGTYKELLEARRSLHTHMTKRHYSSIQRSKAFFYQHANKGGRLLARILRGPQGMTQVHKLRTSDGTITQFPDKIASEFRTFYASLYNIPGPTLPEEEPQDPPQTGTDAWSDTYYAVVTDDRTTFPFILPYPPSHTPRPTTPHPALPSSSPSPFLLLLTQLTLIFSLKLPNNGFIINYMINVARLNPRLPTIVSLTHTCTSKWTQTPSSRNYTTRIRHVPERHLTYDDGPIDLTTPKRMRLKGDKEILEDHIKQTQGTNL